MNNTCCHCNNKETLEGQNSMIGCNVDNKLHDMDDTCENFNNSVDEKEISI